MFCLTLYYDNYNNNIMKGALKNQRTQNSRLLSLEPDTESVGVLTPVHVEDIVRDRNLDYLQTLGELVQKMHATPVWYEYQTNQNKVKFLEIYQLAISYARNTEAIYSGILNEFQDEFEKKKQKVKKLKSEILSHKEKTLKMRKYYRKEKLNKEKQKVLNYEKNIKILRDDMLRQKRQLEEKNEKLFNQERLRQQSKMQSQNYGASFGYNQPGMAFPPQAYHPYAYPPYHQPNYQFTNVPPMSNPQNPFLNLFQPKAPEPNTQQIKPHQKATREQKNPQKNENTIYNTKKNENKTINEQNGIELTNSFVEQVQIKNLKPKEKKQQLKISEARSEALLNTDKSYSFKQSNNIRSSNMESQNNDEVKQLYPNSLLDKRSGLQARLSNKSIDFLQNDLNSIMDIQLKTQSKNDLDNNLNKPIVKRTSIADEIIEQPKSQVINPKSNIKRKDSPQITHKQEKPSVKFKQQEKEKEKNNSFDGNFSIKITKAKEVKSPEPDRKSLNFNNNYLAQSNQGKAYQGTFKTPQIRLRQADKMRASATNSLDDQSKIGGSRNDLSYPNDFQDEQEEKNTRIKIHLDTNSSPQTQRYQQLFVPLFKNYFMLKQEAKGLQDSNVSGIGSLKQFSVKFIGSQRRKTQNQKSVKAESENMQEIDMPENSVIAKPSKLKQSTIRKSTIQHKIHKSHDERVGQFQDKTPAKSKILGKQKEAPKYDPNFQKINTNLKSIRLTKESAQKQNFLTIPKPEQKLSMSMTQSHILIDEVIEQQRQDKQSDKQSIDLSVIPQSQNQSRFTQNTNKNRILILIDRKYNQKGTIQFDKNLIRKQIMAVMPKNSQESDGFSWQQLTERFNEMARKKQIQVNVLKEERTKKFKQFKEIHSNKIPSKKSSKTKNETKSNEKIKEQDDLTYSRSLIENVPSQKIKGFEDPSTKIQLPNHNSLKQNKTALTNEKNNESKLSQKQSKFIRESSTNKNRELNKIIQKNKFNHDDEIENAVKANYKKSFNALPKSDQQF